MELKFYYCKHCGKVIVIVKNTPVPTICCGEPMVELVPGVTDAASEKHVPVISIEKNVVTVSVGEVAHPMQEEHLIEWILLKTNKGIQQKWLKPGDEPKSTFVLSEDEPKATFVLAEGEKVEAAYEYCNLHKLWKASV